MLGLTSVEDPAPVSLGNFTYEDSGEPVQTFRLEGEQGHPPFRDPITYDVHTELGVGVEFVAQGAMYK